MSSIIDPEKLKQAYTKLCTTKRHKYSYGTAGFRDKALYLDTVIFTTAISACVRSIELQGRPIGVMITASHNPPEDNGVKIVEPRGEMLIPEWEPVATNLANMVGFAESYDKFASYLFEELLPKHPGLRGGVNSLTSPLIVLGYDSRESSLRLAECFLNTLKVFNAHCSPTVVNHGLVTTPQLHFLTYLQNENRGNETEFSYKDYESYFYEAWETACDLYNLKFGSKSVDQNQNQKQNQNGLPFDKLVVDCANGVGSLKLKQFLFDKFPREFTSHFQFINDDWEHPEMLNRECGADFVKTNQCLPRGVDVNSLKGALCCSLDGDADRIVFYFIDEGGKFRLLDGDRIATLLAKFFQWQQTEGQLENLKLGVVQTAYANGSSTKYLTDTLRCPVTCTKTGVKHLHHAAQENYDIGVYFEANGHGTVLFSEKFYDTCRQNSTSSPTYKKLMAFSRVINHTVGDAMTDLLAVILTLGILNWTPARWYEEYTDLPNKLTKVVVPDRTIYKTTNEERTLLSPEGIQTRIDALVSHVKSGRAFVRPSGTEDAVRVYCEGADAEEVELLSGQIAELLV